MRKIKFRIWDKENSKFVKYGDGDYREWCVRSDGSVGWISKDGYLQDGDRELIPHRFTGLLDKRGVEIYEGDIVNLGGEENFEIVWFVDDARFWLYGLKNRRGLTLGLFKRSEVIGNIYENPELLKETK